MAAPGDSSPILDWEESAHRTVGDEWGEWLARAWDWEVFATLTFADPKDRVGHTSVGWGLSDRLYREWTDRLQERLPLGDSLYWVRAREPHQMRNSTHFHALIGGVGNLSRRLMWEDWKARNGMARVEPVSTKGATFYVAKYVNKTGGELTFSDNAGFHKKESDSGTGRHGHRGIPEWQVG